LADPVTWKSPSITGARCRDAVVGLWLSFGAGKAADLLATKCGNNPLRALRGSLFAGLRADICERATLVRHPPAAIASA